MIEDDVCENNQNNISRMYRQGPGSSALQYAFLQFRRLFSSYTKKTSDMFDFFCAGRGKTESEKGVLYGHLWRLGVKESSADLCRLSPGVRRTDIGRQITTNAEARPAPLTAARCTRVSSFQENWLILRTIDLRSIVAVVLGRPGRIYFRPL